MTAADVMRLKAGDKIEARFNSETETPTPGEVKYNGVGVVVVRWSKSPVDSVYHWGTRGSRCGVLRSLRSGLIWCIPLQ